MTAAAATRMLGRFTYMFDLRLAVPAFIFLLTACGPSQDGIASEYVPRNGDIIFHTSQSAQSVAIQRATHSPYSHMGIVYVEEGQPFVYEAVQPVKLARLEDWERRGRGWPFCGQASAGCGPASHVRQPLENEDGGKKVSGKERTTSTSNGQTTGLTAQSWSGKSTSERWASRSAPLRCLATSIFPIPQ